MSKAVEIIIEENIIESTVSTVMHESMLPYAECVILDRALPRVEDGLKPVHRRILYSMKELGLTPDKPHKKCARIVGDCLGKYHPHGDSSVYGALVRLAQPYNMSMTLVDGHGNFGSVDGDSPAAMRYTEARMTSLAMEMLKDIEKDTVDWAFNFDDTLREPKTLPCKFPNLLVNGAMGIAVGLATNIPPHNLTEVINGAVALIDNPKMTTKDIIEYIKAPDFPTGGEIIIPTDLVETYETGRGKVLIRAKIHIEPAEYGKKNIVITELPYQVAKAKLLEKIADLRERKKGILLGISDIVDESDRMGMRAVITVRKDFNAQDIVQYLLKYSDLQIAFNINMVAIADGKPRQMGVIEILKYYLEYHRSVVLRRTNFELNAAKERLKILQGLLIAIKNIDEVIQIIKLAGSVSEAKANLRARFTLLEVQAQAILDMRLSRLTKLETTKLEKEIAELNEIIAEYSSISASKRRQMTVVRNELLDVRKSFKKDRQSLINGKKDAAVIDIKELTEEDDLKTGVLVMTYDNKIKLITNRGFNTNVKDISGLEHQQVVTNIAVIDKKHDYYMLTNLGNVVKLNSKILPEKVYKDTGELLSVINKNITEDESVVSILSTPKGEIDEHKLVCFVTKSGMIKKTELGELIVRKDYYSVFNLKDDDKLMYVDYIDNTKTILFVSSNGMALNVNFEDIPLQKRMAGGVAGIKLDDGAKVISASQVSDMEELIVLTQIGSIKKTSILNFPVSTRYRKGMIVMEGVTSKNQVVFAGVAGLATDIGAMLEGNLEATFQIKINDIPTLSKGHKGKKIVNAGTKVLHGLKLYNNNI